MKIATGAQGSFGRVSVHQLSPCAFPRVTLLLPQRTKIENTSRAHHVINGSQWGWQRCGVGPEVQVQVPYSFFFNSSPLPLLFLLLPSRLIPPNLRFLLLLTLPSLPPLLLLFLTFFLFLLPILFLLPSLPLPPPLPSSLLLSPPPPSLLPLLPPFPPLLLLPLLLFLLSSFPTKSSLCCSAGLKSRARPDVWSTYRGSHHYRKLSLPLPAAHKCQQLLSQ